MRLYSHLIITSAESVKLNWNQNLAMKCVNSIIDTHGAVRELLLDSRAAKVKNPGVNDSVFKEAFACSIIKQVENAANMLLPESGVDLRKFEDRFNFCLFNILTHQIKCFNYIF